MKFFICLSTIFGDKTLYACEGKTAEFFTSHPGAKWKRVEYSCAGDAEMFIDRQYPDTRFPVIVCSDMGEN